MKAKKTNQSKDSLVKENALKIFVLGIILLSLSSCQKDFWGYDGFDGRAYLALSWSEAEPEYIEPGSNSIPAFFYWDEYYRTDPGLYTMYYDGYYWDRGWVEYAWEVDYEIWINYGERGGPFYDGMDGLDNYFVIECNPFGPYVFMDLKSTTLDPKYEVIESNEDQTTLIMKEKYFSMKLNYRKVEKRVNIQQQASK